MGYLPTPKQFLYRAFDFLKKEGKLLFLVKMLYIILKVELFIIIIFVKRKNLKN